MVQSQSKIDSTGGWDVGEMRAHIPCVANEYTSYEPIVQQTFYLAPISSWYSAKVLGPKGLMVDGGWWPEKCQANFRV